MNELQDFIDCLEKEIKKNIILILELTEELKKEEFKKLSEELKKKEDKKNDNIDNN